MKEMANKSERPPCLTALDKCDKLPNIDNGKVWLYVKKDKRNTSFYLALVIFCLTGQVAWVVENMYFNVFIYKMFHASAEAISAMVAASAVAATVTTVLIGALSDKIGKRKIFICGGYIAWVSASGASA